MFALRPAVRTGQEVGKWAVQTRTIYSTIPRVRISFAEKVAHGIAIAIGMLTFPAYILVNIKHYRQ